VAAADAGSGIPRASEFRAIAGRGIVARVEGHEIAVGGPALLRERGVSVPDAVTSAVESWGARGATVVTVLRDGRIIGALAVADAVRPGSAEAVRALTREGIRVAMVTGDSRQVAEAVAADLGIEEVHAEVLPEHKASVVEGLRRSGRRVAMIGDGVNDAPALATADVGIAIGAGTDVAIESAGVVLAADDPRGVLGVVRLSSSSYRKMLQNLVWATGYNVISIPLAAGALAWAGILPSPAVGAVFMSVSTIVVALNAQLLRRLDLRPA
jgi:Cu2+-exporting ATPase